MQNLFSLCRFTDHDRKKPYTPKGLTKRFGSFVAVDELDLSVDEGTVVSLLGPNGAGKTTIVRMLATLIAPDAGQARVAGYDVVADAARVRERISLTGQFAALDKHLTARENLILMARLRGRSGRAARAVADELMERFDAVEFRDRLVKQLSGGERRRVDLAAGLIDRPHVLVLDEPTTGLDPRSRQVVWATIRELVDEGVTLLLTTQYLEEADALADKVVLLDHGREVAAGTPAALKAQVGQQRVDVVAADGRRLRAAALGARGPLRDHGARAAAHDLGRRASRDRRPGAGGRRRARRRDRRRRDRPAPSHAGRRVPGPHGSPRPF